MTQPNRKSPDKIAAFIINRTYGQARRKAIVEAIEIERAFYEAKLKRIEDLVHDDVPHQYQDRLFEERY